ncbi:hypothetical protein Cs7R123_12250 [Catellatospora sp. TT07R-123]|uniref:YcxB family protein n=1 Tax=Catellatospora sp. TT07R-123 TaxID=2733863 RepID=UPI001B061EBB|nr:YcxB family protein [Catellatospora sp. TT07R-123]GHJ43883.1 hypothetical protein Cs7R123_12250 [Catellatospora sp. TT07R-123]
MSHTSQLDLRVAQPFDRDRVLANLRLVHAPRLHKNRSFGIAAGLVGVGGAVLLLVYDRMSVYVVLLLMLAASGWYLRWATERWFTTGIDDLPAVCREDGVLTLTEDRIIQEFPQLRSELAWSAVVRAVETPAGWLLYYGRWHTVSVPRAGLTDEQIDQLRAFLTARGHLG